MYQMRLTATVAVILSMALLGSACAENRTQTDRRVTKASAPQNQLQAQATKEGQNGDQQFLQGSQKDFGRVEAVTSDQIKVDIGEMQPRFLPLKQAE
jgi:hypothetical protein